MLTQLQEAILALEHALSFLPKAKKDRFYFSGISKSFEVCLEYTWKYLKQQLAEEGLEAYSPREIFKIAARAGRLEALSPWLDFLENRNLSVHDYLGISEEDYLNSIQVFLVEVKKLIAKK